VPTWLLPSVARTVCEYVPDGNSANRLKNTKLDYGKVNGISINR
jgi:hypothetical protein